MNREETGRQEDREGMEQVMQDLLGLGEDLGFYAMRGGSPGGLDVLGSADMLAHAPDMATCSVSLFFSFFFPLW